MTVVGDVGGHKIIAVGDMRKIFGDNIKNLPTLDLERLEKIKQVFGSFEYDYKEFTLTPDVLDYDVKANITELFNKVRVANYVSIENVTGGDIAIKFNDVNNAYIPIPDGETLQISILAVENIFITKGNYYGYDYGAGTPNSFKIMLIGF